MRALFSATSSVLPRRAFLRVSGASAATTALVLAGCGGSSSNPTPSTTIVLPSGDAGIVNYLLLLEQLETALYTRILAAPPADLPATERDYLANIADHNVVYRETYKYALGTNGLAALSFDFTSFNLSTRAGALAAARQIADLIVAAYLGALPFLSNIYWLRTTLKINSVKARHAALLRDLLVPGSFAGSDVVQAAGSLNAGQNMSLTPTDVITVVAPFVETYTISVVNLPTS